MILQYIPELNQIRATDATISEFAGNLTLYSSVEMTTTVTCGMPTVVEYLTSVIADSSNFFYLENDYIVITPLMFSGGFIDGIYRVDIKFKDANGYTRIYNCIFIDITFKCRLAGMLSALLDEDFASETAHLLHYSLVNGSNCGCECDEMCTNFNSLKAILDNQPTKVTDCGCR